MTQSEHQQNHSIKRVFKSLFITIGCLAILASGYSLATEGFDPANFTGLFSGAMLITLSFAVNKLE